MTHAFYKKHRAGALRYSNVLAGIIAPKQVFTLGLFLSFCFSTSVVQSATITSNNVTGFWDAASSWVGGVVPGSGDAVIINASATITVRTNVSCLSLTWTGNPTASRTLTINAGSSLTVSGSITLGAATSNNRNRVINVLGTLNCGGNFNMQTSGANSRDVELDIGTSGTVTITGNLIMASAYARHHVDMTGNAVINIAGNIGNAASPTAVGGGFTSPPSTSTINLNGTSTQNVFLYGGASALGRLKINNPVAVTSRSTMTVTTLTIGDVVSSSVFKDSGYQVTSTGTINLNNASRFLLGRAGTASSFPAFGTRNIDLGTTVEYIAGATQTISTTPNYANLLLSGASKTIASGTLSVRQNLTINSGATFAGSSNNPATNLGGNFLNSGTFTSGTGLFTMNGTVNQSITGTATFSGGFTINNTGGSGSNTITINNNIATTGNLTLTNGVFNLGSFTANRTAAGGTMTIANGTRMMIGGTNGLPVNYSTHSIGATSTVEYNGTTNVVTTPNSSQAYGFLVIAANNATTSGTFSIVRTLTVTGSLTASAGTITMSNAASSISNSGTLTFNNLTVSATPTAQSQYNTSFTVAGTFTKNGGVTFTPPGGTITMSGAAGAISNAWGTLTFSHLTISGTMVSATGNFGVAGTMSVTGEFNPSATSIISGAGTLTGTGTVNVTRTAASPSLAGQYTITNKTLEDLTVDYTGAGAQTVSAADYGNLVISTNGTRTVTLVNVGVIRVSRVFTPTAVNTTYVITDNTFEFNGEDDQVIPAFTFETLVISNSGDKFIQNGVIVNCDTIELNDDAQLNIADAATLNVVNGF